MIGAEGEILFGVKPGVTGRVRVRLPDGLERGARVLGFDRDLGVGVARLEGSGLPRLVPPPVKVDAQLVRDCWLVVLTHDEAGKPTSHAGQVLEESPRGPARVEVPGRAGSPVLSAEGALVGLAIARGRRQVPVRPMAHLMPFLERVVIGSARER